MQICEWQGADVPNAFERVVGVGHVDIADELDQDIEAFDCAAKLCRRRKRVEGEGLRVDRLPEGEYARV